MALAPSVWLGDDGNVAGIFVGSIIIDNRGLLWEAAETPRTYLQQGICLAYPIKMHAVRGRGNRNTLTVNRTPGASVQHMKLVLKIAESVTDTAMPVQVLTTQLEKRRKYYRDLWAESAIRRQTRDNVQEKRNRSDAAVRANGVRTY